MESGGQNIRSGEGQILKRHRLGDAEAFAELIELYRKPVYSYLYRCGVGRDDRDDLFQEVFLKVHRAASSYDDERPLHPWIFTIVANTVRNHLRRRRGRLRLFFRSPAKPSWESWDEEPLVEPADSRPDGERQAAARETGTWLNSQVQELPEEQRQVLLLASVEQMPLKDVAAALDVPLNTVKTRLYRARLSLGRALARFQGRLSEESS